MDGDAQTPEARMAAEALVSRAIGDRKRPLFRALPPATDFPIMALGELRPAAEAVHEMTRAPIAVCAQSVLAAATLAVQAHYDVELPGGGRRPLTALFVSVLECQATCKTPPVVTRGTQPPCVAGERWNA